MAQTAGDAAREGASGDGSNQYLGEALADSLHEQGLNVSVVNPAATAALLLAEFYDLAHYTSAKAVAADAGVTPAKFQSGTSVHRKAKMSRIGQAGVREALYWPAQSAIQWTPLVSRLAERLRQRGKPFKVILVAAMPKLLHLVFGVVKNNTPFDPDFGNHSSAFQRNICQGLEIPFREKSRQFGPLSRVKVRLKTCQVLFSER